MSEDFIKTDDDVSLYYEEAGIGAPIVFVHEFAGDCRSWEPQLRYFSRRYRAIAFNARGYPPSDVPERQESYSQQRACDDIRSVLDGLGLKRAHIVGLSMGGFATLHFGLTYPDRALSLLVAGCGYGAEKDRREQFRAEADAIAAELVEKGMKAFAERYSLGPSRVQFEAKDPRGWREFREELAKHSAVGATLTQMGVQKERPSLFDLEEALGRLRVPTMIVSGDEDWPCLVPGIFLKRVIPSAALAVMPSSGHAVNLEEPDSFNRLVERFLAQVDAGRWPERDPRAMSNSLTGMT
jgi:pimeloyl-ACP methyl ester carboxylesterase